MSAQIMTAYQKRKLAFQKIQALLPEQPLFVKYNRLWLYSAKGQYVVSFDIDMSISGYINDIRLSYSTFYLPIKIAEVDKKWLRTDSAWYKIGFFTRLYGATPHFGLYKDCIWRNGKSTPIYYTDIEEQIDDFMSVISQQIVPYLSQLNDQLETYLYVMKKLDLICYQYIPFLSLYQPEERVLAYLSLNKPEEACKTAIEFMSYLEKAHETVRTDRELTNRFPDVQQHRIMWITEAIEKSKGIIRKIENDDITELLELADERCKSSSEICEVYFGKRKPQ